MDVPSIGSVMIEAPAPLGPDDSLEYAEALLRGARVRHWPVVGSGEVVGMLALRDLLWKRRKSDESAVAAVLKVRELMKRPAVIMHPAEDVVAAAGRMRRHRLGSLPVVAAGRLVGVVTARRVVGCAVDALRREAAYLGSAPRVARLMTYAPLCTVELLERVDLALRLMRRYAVRHLLVMRGDKLLGMLSERDVLEILRTSLDPPAAILVGEIMTPSPATTTPESRAALAGALLLEEHVGALPVTRGQRVIGVLSKGDFLSYLAATRPLAENVIAGTNRMQEERLGYAPS
jgi:CBS domain-containing protein